MDTFEKKLAEAISHPNPQVLGVIATVIDRSGTPNRPCNYTTTHN
jgi:hypothetical protein